MKKYLLVILLFVCIFLTGCTVDYDVKFDKDLKVTETISVMTEHKDIEKYLKYQTRDELLEGLYENTSYYEDSNATFKDISKTGYVGGEITTSYRDLATYLRNSQAIHDMFGSYDLQYEDNKIYFILENFYPLSATTSSRGKIDEVNVTITSPYRIKGFKSSSCKIEDDNFVCSFKLKQDTDITGIKFYIDKLSSTSKTMVFYVISGIIVFMLFGSIVYLKIKNKNNI